MTLYVPTNQPYHADTAHSKVIRNEFKLIETAFAQLTADLDAIIAATEFAKLYQGAYVSHPKKRRNGTALQPGDLYYSTREMKMMVFDGLDWVGIELSVEGLLTLDAMTRLLSDELTSATASAANRALELNTAVWSLLNTEIDRRIAGDADATALEPVTGNFIPKLSTSSGLGYEDLDARGLYYKIGQLVFISMTIKITGSKLLNDLGMAFVEVPYRAALSTHLWGGSVPMWLTNGAYGRLRPYVAQYDPGSGGQVYFNLATVTDPTLPVYPATPRQLETLFGANPTIHVSGLYATV